MEVIEILGECKVLAGIAATMEIPDNRRCMIDSQIDHAPSDVHFALGAGAAEVIVNVPGASEYFPLPAGHSLRWAV